VRRSIGYLSEIPSAPAVRTTANSYAIADDVGTTRGRTQGGPLLGKGYTTLSPIYHEVK